MKQLWNANPGSLEINSMPFYWRLSEHFGQHPSISSSLPIRVSCNEEMDYLYFKPTKEEWSIMDAAYKEDENIGFINPESGQMDTYGASVNAFILDTISKVKPEKAYEIGCGAGFTIRFLMKNGWQVTGIDPSAYSLGWSQKLAFPLLNTFFNSSLLPGSADFIYCNDLFEHVVEVEKFCREVYDSLDDGGVFCIATTNSTDSIQLGDISMFEHQHVNMFTRRSIFLILNTAGFKDVSVEKGRYGNTFHITARKKDACVSGTNEDIPQPHCEGYFERAAERIESFTEFYNKQGPLSCYVPLRCLPYLSCVGDFGESLIFDSNYSWKGKYIDGYASPVMHLDDIPTADTEIKHTHFFIGSLTFYTEIRDSLIKKGISPDNILSINTLN